MAPWTPPPCPEALHELLPWRAWDEGSELYINESSHGFALELPPFAGIDAETLGALAGVLADAAPERCTIQVIHWASPRFGAPLSAWAAARRQPAARCKPAARGQPAARRNPAAPGRSAAPDISAALHESAVRQHESGVREPESAVRQHGLLSVMAERRERLFGHAGWSPLHPGGPPFTCADYRVFVTASLAGRPGPASETALGAFRRALEGTLASAGAHARRLQPDALLSLAVELIAPAVGKSGGDSERSVVAPAAALVAEGSAAQPVRLPGAGDDRDAGGARVSRPRRRRRRGARAHRAGLSGGVAGVARQRADRGFPPRLPATGLPGADLPHRHDRRHRRRRESFSEIRSRDTTSRHRHLPLPARPAGKSPGLALRHRTAQGRRAPGQGVLFRGRVCPRRQRSTRPNRRCGPSTTARAGGWLRSGMCNCRRGCLACRCSRPEAWTRISRGWGA